MMQSKCELTLIRASLSHLERTLSDCGEDPRLTRAILTLLPEDREPETELALRARAVADAADCFEDIADEIAKRAKRLRQAAT